MGALGEHAVQPLIRSAAWRQLQRLAAQFSVPVHTVCFECRLSDSDDRVDLAFLLPPGFDAQRALALIRAQHPNEPAWLRFADFVRAWSAPGSLLALEIPFLCVAFDVNAATAELPEPCVSLCVDPDFFPKRLGLPCSSPQDTGSLLRLAEECYSQLTARSLPPAAREAIALWLTGSEQVEAKHLSVMLPRGDAPLKLDVRLPIALLSRFLSRIAWPANAQLIDGLRELVPWDGHVQLNLIAHPAGEAPLELELFAGEPEVPFERRAVVLERLVRLGLATQEKARVLREAWLSPLSADEHGLMVARSWYLKLRLAGAASSDAKAYLALMPRLSRQPSLVAPPLGH